MKIKCSLALFLLSIIAAFCAPTIACAALYLPESSPATTTSEQLVFSPPLYLTLLCGLLLVCATATCTVLALQLKRQKMLVCSNVYCFNNPYARETGAGLFDYRELETPEELRMGHYEHSDAIVEEAIKHLISEQAVLQAPRAFAQKPGAAEPVVRVEPTEHAQPVEHTEHPEQGGRTEHREHAEQGGRSPWIPAHARPATEKSNTEPNIRLVPRMRHARKPAPSAGAASIASIANTASIASAASTASTASVVGVACKDSVPKELEELLRKIS